MNFLLSDYTILFLIVTVGILLGKVKIKGISFDTSAIFFVALFFGSHGLQVPIIVEQIGLIFFMYSIGIQAGPRFFESFKSQGKQLLLLAIILSFSGGIITVVLSKIFDVDILLSVGLFTGSLTSASSLAITLENTNSALPSVGFGIAFPFGVIGVVLITRLSPKIFNIDIHQEEIKEKAENRLVYPKLFTKNFIVQNPKVFNKTIGELKLRTTTNTNISKIYQRYALVSPKSSTILCKDDIIKACGTKEDLNLLKKIIGKESTIELPVQKKYTIKHYIVTNDKVINKQLGRLDILHMLNITITTIRRSGIEIIPNAHSKLHIGDRINVTGPEENMEKIKKLFGNEKSKLDELDFLPIVLTMLIGIGIGSIPILYPISPNIKLGLTGGVLISALILSNIGKTGKIIWNISGPSNQFLRKLGLITFLAGVGTDAGANIINTINDQGLHLFLMAIVITVLPMFITLFVGRYLLKLNFLRLLGGLTGSMTSTPALSAIEPLTKSNAPQVSYATVYPIALILIIIVSQLITLL